MNINLMFSSINNQILWENQINDFDETTVDLNVSTIATFLENLNVDFPKIYLLKPCINIEDSNYRLDIMDEIFNNKDLKDKLTLFSDNIKTLSQQLFELKKEVKDMQKMYRYLRIVCEYFLCIESIVENLREAKSIGLKSLKDYCNNILNDNILNNLNKISNNLLIDIETMLENNILVLEPLNKLFFFEKCNPEFNETEILKVNILDKFGLDINNSFSIVDPAPLSNMEEKILNEISNINPSTFKKLHEFYNQAIEYFDEIELFSRIYKQFSFYLTYIDFLYNALKNGISICKPVFNDAIFASINTANISLVINKLEKKAELSTIVLNDIRLPSNKMFFLSGPNQGGKTVYLMSVGLTAYFAKCGCFVLAKTCKLPFYEIIATHFMKEEVLGKGRLVEEVERMEGLLKKINSNTLILLNESFTSTRRIDGVRLSIYYLNKLGEIGCSVGMVSHYYEIPELFNESDILITLSSGKDEKGNRNYKVVESSGEKFAYARDIAVKSEMTYEQIVKFIRGENHEKY